MGNYLILIISVLTVAPVVLGLLFGMIRGSRRAILRLILVALCLVAAFLLSGMVADKLLQADVTQFVNGKAPENGESIGNGESTASVTLEQYLQNMLGEQFADMKDYIIPLVQIFAKIVTFYLLFLLLMFISWLIIFPICKIFVRPRKVKDGQGNVIGKKKHPLFGGLIGLVQGVAVAVCLCIVANGLFAQITTFAHIYDGVAEISQNLNSGEPEPQSEGAAEGNQIAALFDTLKEMVADYNESTLGKLYNKIGEKPFASFAQVTNENGETFTLQGQLDAYRCVIDIAKELTKLTKLNYENFYADNNLTTLTTVLNNVQTAKQGLSEETGKTVTGMMTVVGKLVGVDESIFERFMSINLAKEAEAFAKLSAYKDKDLSEITIDDAKDILESLAQSDLMFELLSSQDAVDLGNGLDPEQREQLNNALDAMAESGDLSQTAVDRLRNIFKLQQTNPDDNTTTENPDLSDEAQTE